MEDGGGGHGAAEVAPDVRRQMLNKMVGYAAEVFCDYDIQQIESTLGRYEEKLFRKSSGLQNYLRGIAMKMLTIQKHQQQLALHAASGHEQQQLQVQMQMQPPCAVHAVQSPQDSATVDGPVISDWKDEILQKITSLSNAFLPELKEFDQAIDFQRAREEEELQSLPKDQADRRRRHTKLLKAAIGSSLNFLRLEKSKMDTEPKEKLEEKLGKCETVVRKLVDHHRERKVRAAQTSIQRRPQPQEQSYASSDESSRKRRRTLNHSDAC